MTNEDTYVSAGLYDPSTHATTGRLDLLNWLTERGFTIQQMQRANALNILAALAGDAKLLPGKLLSPQETIEATGLTQERLDAIADSFGLLPLEGDDEVLFTVPEAESLAYVAAAADMFSPEDAQLLFRVFGSAFNRIAEAANAIYLTGIESDMIAESVNELEMAQRQLGAISLIDGLLENLDPLFRRMMIQATARSRRSLIDTQERSIYRYAVGFVDLVGFTEISQSMAPGELSTFIRDFEDRAHQILNKAGARLVKLIGDEVMFVSADPTAACAGAAELMSGFTSDELRVVPRGGLAYGNVLTQGGDYYGSIVNLASRLVDAAVPEELLVTSQLAEASDGFGFEPAGRRMVKAFADPIVVLSLAGGASRTAT